MELFIFMEKTGKSFQRHFSGLDGIKEWEFRRQGLL